MFGHIYAFFWFLVVILCIGIAVWGYFR